MSLVEAPHWIMWLHAARRQRAAGDRRKCYKKKWDRLVRRRTPRHVFVLLRVVVTGAHAILGIGSEDCRSVRRVWCLPIGCALPTWRDEGRASLQPRIQAGLVA
jgi:hypothetical protein